MSTFVPIEAKGGIMLHPGPGRSLQARDHSQLVNKSPFPVPLFLVPKLCWAEASPLPVLLPRQTLRSSAINLLHQYEAIHGIPF